MHPLHPLAKLQCCGTGALFCKSWKTWHKWTMNNSDQIIKCHMTLAMYIVLFRSSLLASRNATRAGLSALPSRKQHLLMPSSGNVPAKWTTSDIPRNKNSDSCFDLKPWLTMVWKVKGTFIELVVANPTAIFFAKKTFCFCLLTRHGIALRSNLPPASETPTQELHTSGSWKEERTEWSMQCLLQNVAVENIEVTINLAVITAWCVKKTRTLTCIQTLKLAR